MLPAVVQAGNRIRTGDLNLGKVALYQLSYTRVYYTRRLAATGSRKPPVGFEPTTAALRMRCSTPELRWRAVARYRSWIRCDGVEPAGFEPATS